MQRLNFPVYHFRFKNTENTPYIFDVIRKKFVVLQPEEWVRQHVLLYLMQEKKYPKSLINVEKQLMLNGLKKRTDIIIFQPDGRLELLVECKAPQIAITQDTFDQIAMYNLKLKANYLMVTNGLQHYCCEMDWIAEKYRFLPEIPDFSR
ncbi:Restriction endonuclease, type I, EcoRI, R subunit/Type III [Croceitalea dokdonensis DOKDO 023]|uniref:Restriction endonuclease, type I, EcoRI, R subunit/Type III n=1 Tax=Croceitalea dokdonensis DOKDO 023 TaxID=1300341 RepID=A0A0P7AZ49_9FLAO|nr:type I restriction enzyme HsdR N-terminal domain-containing protein [Croceitalea dokdonensis]KPM33528.1 Restriction endonuclease, type I, EcoRI, R subunit/Type III [Croceitalea dokdonensis DOKDO 023]